VLTGKQCAQQWIVQPAAPLGSMDCIFALSDEVASQLALSFDLDAHCQTPVMQHQNDVPVMVYRPLNTGLKLQHRVVQLGAVLLALHSGDVLVLGNPSPVSDSHYAVQVRFEHRYF
jgi:hypothetical protein